MHDVSKLNSQTIRLEKAFEKTFEKAFEETIKKTIEKIIKKTIEETIKKDTKKRFLEKNDILIREIRSISVENRV